MNEGNERKFEIQVDEAILSTVLDIWHSTKHTSNKGKLKSQITIAWNTNMCYIFGNQWVYVNQIWHSRRKSSQKLVAKQKFLLVLGEGSRGHIRVNFIPFGRYFGSQMKTLNEVERGWKRMKEWLQVTLILEWLKPLYNISIQTLSQPQSFFSRLNWESIATCAICNIWRRSELPLLLTALLIILYLQRVNTIPQKAGMDTR